MTTAAALAAEKLLGTRLPARPAEGRDVAALAALAHRLRLGPEAWPLLAESIAFDARGYRRVRLFRDADWEGLLLCWLPGQRTSVHDHGGSTGVSIVLMGALHETRFETSAAGALHVLGCADAGPGHSMLEAVTTIHEVANEGVQPAISLHLYSPPLTVLGAYDRDTGRRWDVDVRDSPVVQVGGDPRLAP